MAQHYHSANTHSNPPTRDNTQYYPTYHLAPLPGQSIEHPPPQPGPYGQHSSVSSFHLLHSDAGSYNTADYYQLGTMFKEMIHQLAEDNMRSDLTTALESSIIHNAATMLPIAWEEIYPESIGIKEDICHLV